jgi:hypothetical protein
VIRWPEGIDEPGRHVHSLVSIMDFAPTFLEVAQAGTLNGGGSGLSLLPWLRNEEVKAEHWRDAVFNQCNGVEILYTQRMVRTDRYKFVYNPCDFDELYDLHEDPYEMVNLVNDLKLKPLIAKLYRKMWHEGSSKRRPDFQSVPVHCDGGNRAGAGHWRGCGGRLAVVRLFDQGSKSVNAEQEKKEHPFLNVFDDTSDVTDLQTRYPYFHLEQPLRIEGLLRYSDPEANQQSVEYSWSYSFSDILNALIAAGLRLDYLHEFPHGGNQRFPFMVQGEDGRWRWKDSANNIPLTFSLQATKE